MINLSQGREILRCQRCSLLARTPMPPEEELTEWYRERYWNHYGAEQVGSKRSNVYIHALAWVERLRPNPRILVDVGCGSGT